MIRPRICSTASQANFVKVRRLSVSKKPAQKGDEEHKAKVGERSCFDFESMSHLSWKLLSGAKNDTQTVNTPNSATRPMFCLK